MHIFGRMEAVDMLHLCKLMILRLLRCCHNYSTITPAACRFVKVLDNISHRVHQFFSMFFLYVTYSQVVFIFAYMCETMLRHQCIVCLHACVSLG